MKKGHSILSESDSWTDKVTLLLVGLGERFAWGEGNCLKYLKSGRTENKRGDTKILKRGQAGSSRGGCLKKEELEHPYELWLTNVIFSGALWRDKWSLGSCLQRSSNPIFYGMCCL